MMHSLTWITIFGSLVMRFANDFHSWLRHSGKSLANRLTHDPKTLFTVTHALFFIYMCIKLDHVITALDCIPLYLKIYLILYYHKMHDFIFSTFQLLQLHYFFAGTIRVVGNKKGLFSRNRQPKMAAYELWRRYHNLMNISIANNQQLSDLHDLNFIPQLMQSQRHDIIWIHNSWNLYKIYNSLVVTFTVTLQHFLFLIFSATTRVVGNKKGLFSRNRQPKMAAYDIRRRYHNLMNHTSTRIQQTLDLHDFNVIPQLLQFEGYDDLWSWI